MRVHVRMYVRIGGNIHVHVLLNTKIGYPVHQGRDALCLA